MVAACRGVILDAAIFCLCQPVTTKSKSNRPKPIGCSEGIAGELILQGSCIPISKRTSYLRFQIAAPCHVGFGSYLTDLTSARKQKQENHRSDMGKGGWRQLLTSGLLGIARRQWSNAGELVPSGEWTMARGSLGDFVGEEHRDGIRRQQPSQIC